MKWQHIDWNRDFYWDFFVHESLSHVTHNWLLKYSFQLCHSCSHCQLHELSAMRTNQTLFENLQFSRKTKHSRFWWMKKLKSLITDFRTISKKFWTSDYHVLIDEQLIEYRERSIHTMQLVFKATEVSFKLYSLCQDNYLIDYLFIFKDWSQIMKILS
jgi:hypothetical protein